MRTLVVALSAGALLCQAGVIIGNPTDPSGNCFPFGCVIPGFSSTTYQQVYASSGFSGPIDIFSVGFFHTQVGLGTGLYNGGTFAISFSTTTKPVNGLDTVTFANNIGADNQAFTSVTLSGLAPNGEIIFDGTAFDYNPANGNLLMSISVTGPLADHDSSGDLFLDERVGTAAGAFSRAHDFGDGFENFGLVTEFNPLEVTPGGAVPEPPTFLLLGGGLVAILASRRKRIQ